MDADTYLRSIPFQEYLGIELVEADDGSAEVRLDLRPELSSSDDRLVAHGGVLSALADSVGGAAAISRTGVVTPTVDLRIDYLAPAETALRATGSVIRTGGTLATVDIDVYDAADSHVATAKGVYKIDGAAPMAWIEADDDS